MKRRRPIGRLSRSVRVRLAHGLRSRLLPVLVAFAAIALFLLWLGRGSPAYGPNLALNLGAELIGTLVVIFALTPIVERAERGRVREHRHLDFAWYIDRVTVATTTIQILHTFTRLLLPPLDRRFLAAADDLMRRGGTVRILLMHPDSAAATRRTAELAGRRDVGAECRRNLQALDAFQRGLDPALWHRFAVRLSSASASVQVYRWDDRLLASFLPLGRLSGDHSQLEVAVDSPLGGFVTERYDELWAESTPMADYWRLGVTLVDDAGEQAYSSRFLAIGDRHYLVDPEVVAHLARVRGGPLHATLRNDAGRLHRVDLVTEELEAAQLSARYMDKYDGFETVFVRLDLQR